MTLFDAVKLKLTLRLYTQWKNQINVTYIRRSHEPGTSNDLVILCHLCVFSSADAFNLYTHLVFALGLYDTFVHHRGVCSSISCMQCYPSNSLVAYQIQFCTIKRFYFQISVGRLQMSPRQNFQATTIHVSIQVCIVKMVLE